MRHVILLILLLLAGYVGWNVANDSQRSSTKRFLKHHGVNVALIAGVIFFAVMAAIYLPSFNIF